MTARAAGLLNGLVRRDAVSLSLPAIRVNLNQWRPAARKSEIILRDILTCDKEGRQRETVLPTLAMRTLPLCHTLVPYLGKYFTSMTEVFQIARGT